MNYMEDKKKIIAAISAVWHQIKMQADTIDRNEDKPLAQQVIAGAMHSPETALSLWRSSGRLAQMRMRTLMQMRMFQASRLK